MKDATKLFDLIVVFLNVFKMRQPVLEQHN